MTGLKVLEVNIHVQGINPPKDVKMVGNTIKSKKMPDYIAKFLEKGIRLLLKGKGQDFIEEYYSYVDKIYNYQLIKNKTR